MTGDPWPERMDVDVGYRDPWDPRDELPAEPPDFDERDAVPLTEAAIEASLDFCQTCGRYAPDGGCPACGEDE